MSIIRLPGIKREDDRRFEKHVNEKSEEYQKTLGKISFENSVSIVGKKVPFLRYYETGRGTSRKGDG